MFIGLEELEQRTLEGDKLMTRYKPAIVLKKVGGRWGRFVSKSLIREIKEDVSDDNTQDKKGQRRKYRYD